MRQPRTVSAGVGRAADANHTPPPPTPRHIWDIFHVSVNVCQILSSPRGKFCYTLQQCCCSGASVFFFWHCINPDVTASYNWAFLVLYNKCNAYLAFLWFLLPFLICLWICVVSSSDFKVEMAILTSSCRCKKKKKRHLTDVIYSSGTTISVLNIQCQISLCAIARYFQSPFRTTNQDLKLRSTWEVKLKMPE